MESRKIAVLCNYQLLPKRVGGMDYFFWQFDAKCKENNIQVDWFFPNHSSHGEYDKLTILESKNVSLESFFLEYCLHNNSKYESVITHFVELCTPFFKKVKQLYNTKIVVVDHNSRPLNGYSFKKKITKKVKGFLFSRYIDEFIGVSDYTVAAIVKDFGFQVQTKTKTIHNGVRIRDIKFRERKIENKPSFLVVSQLVQSKGIQDLIWAVSALPPQILKELEINVFGEGPYKDVLVTLAESRGVISNFIFMGSKPDLNNHYCEYDYMLLPTHMECFNLSILESLAANVPVITTNVGGNEEAVRNGINGYVFNAKDIQALTIILEEVYLGVKKIDLNTRIDIENNFSLDKMVENHIQLL